MNSRLTNSLTDKSCEQEQQPKGSAESVKVKAWMDSCVCGSASAAQPAGEGPNMQDLKDKLERQLMSHRVMEVRAE